MSENFGTAFKIVSRKMRQMKNSLYPHAVNALGEFISMLPSFLSVLITQWVVSKSTMVMSNVPGPKNSFIYSGVHSKGNWGLIPGLGELACGISCMSMKDQIYMAVQAEKTLIEDTREVRDLLNAIYDELVSELKAN